MKHKKERKNMFRIIWWIGIICMFFYAYKHELFNFINKVFYNESALEELTMEQKVEDFEDFYLTITSSAPFLQSVKDLYGIDFVNRKEYYLDEIEKTTSNLEYYGVMKAISKDTVSFHTDLCFPMYSNLQGLDCYNSEDTINQLGMKSKIDAWWREIEKGIEEYDDVDLINVVYVDGKYIVEKGCLPEKYKDMANYELISIDGISAEKYIVDNIAIFDLQYDYQLDQAYRKRWVFNDKIGELVKIVWRDENGKEIEKKLYINKGAEVVWAYGHLFDDKYNYYGEDSEPDIVMERDDINQLEYIKINNFCNNNGNELKKYLLESPYKKIFAGIPI